MHIISVIKILRSLFLLRKKEHRGVIWRSLSLRLYSDTTYLGLRRDLSAAFKSAEAKYHLRYVRSMLRTIYRSLISMSREFHRRAPSIDYTN